MTESTVTIDGTRDPDLLAPEMFDFIRSRYWVCVETGRDASVFEWVMSIREPLPVPNPQMSWRRPTYGEALKWWDLTHTDRMFNVNTSWPDEIKRRMVENGRRYHR